MSSSGIRIERKEKWCLLRDTYFLYIYGIHSAYYVAKAHSVLLDE